MRIHDFEITERLEEISKIHSQVLEIKNSLADNRNVYRAFSQSINISQESILNCCDFFERVLLINCYTFSEQFVKNYIYELLEKGNHNNEYLNHFIDNKIHKDRFSPNVQFKSIENDIKKDLWKDFKFILNKEITEIKVYDEMIRARHTYAHSGNYNFEFSNFIESIKAINYILFELLMLRDSGVTFREKFQNDYREIKDLTISYIKISQNRNNVILKSKLKEVRLKCKFFLQKYNHIIINIEMLEVIKNNIENVSNIDLRSKIDISTGIVDNLKKEIEK